MPQQRRKILPYVVVMQKDSKILEKMHQNNQKSLNIKFELKPQIFLLGVISHNIAEKHHNLLKYMLDGSNNQSGATLEKRNIAVNTGLGDQNRRICSNGKMMCIYS